MKKSIGFISIILLLLTGCDRLTRPIDSPPRSIPPPMSSPTNTHSTPTVNAKQEMAALFAQSYIDPLTRYLEQHESDPRRQSVLKKIRQERDKRCQAIAARYQTRAKTTENLNRLSAGYTYSCPRVVANFAQIVNEQQRNTAEKVEPPATPAPAPTPTQPPPVAATPEPAPPSPPPTAPQSPPQPKQTATAMPVKANPAVSDCQVLFKIRNYAEARTACLPLAKTGNQIAQYNLGEIAALSGDYTIAAQWMQQAAKQGYAPAQYSLGRWFFEGKAAGESSQSAVKWLQQAADQNYPEALMLLGQMYYSGHGLTRDYTQAVKWYRKAALQNEDAEVQTILGELYYQGQGIQRNYQEAANWFKRAAAQGNSVAQLRLGMLYEQGLGTQKNLFDAYIWYSLAASQGNAEGTNARDRIAQQLSTAEVDQALQRARSIASGYQRI